MMRSPRFLIIIVIALAVNFVLVQVVGPKAPDRTRVPYSPTFIDQVKAKNVHDISSQDLAIQGDFVKKIQVDGKDVTKFKTEVPAFADEKTLDAVLQSR
jgi:hypothetical protein